MLFNKENKQTSLLDIIENTEGFYPGNLEHYFQLMWEDPCNKNGYHNFRHHGHALWEGYDASKFERVFGRDLRNLLIAISRHDGKHSPHLGFDNIEIEVALKDLRENILPEDEPYLEQISDLIRITQYPHKASGNLSTLERIMRDADMSQTFSDAWIHSNVFGLAQEAGILPKIMLFKQIKHLQETPFVTNWGQKKFSKARIEKRVLEVLRLIKVLGYQRDYLEYMNIS